MKFCMRLLVWSLGLLAPVGLAGQCTAGFTFSAIDNEVDFQNISTVSNARYYWDLGIGIGSYEENPSFTYPDDGRYDVVLYAQDTLSSCVDVFSATLQITKPDSFPCGLDASVLFTPAVNSLFMSTVDQTTNCPPFSYLDCDAAQQEDNAWSIIVGDTNYRASLLTRVQYIDTAAGAYDIRGEFYLNAVRDFDPMTENYGPCSTNFEVIDLSDSLLPNPEWSVHAMSESAGNYSWRLQRYDSILTTATGPDAQFILPPVATEERADLFLVTLSISDTSNGCTDSLTRQVALVNGNFTPILDLEPAFISQRPFILFPNPAHHQCKISLTQPPLEPWEVVVVNGIGKIVLEGKSDGPEYALRLDQVPAGIYFVGVRENGRVNWERLVRY